MWQKQWGWCDVGSIDFNINNISIIANKFGQIEVLSFLFSEKTPLNLPIIEARSELIDIAVEVAIVFIKLKIIKICDWAYMTMIQC